MLPHGKKQCMLDERTPYKIIKAIIFYYKESQREEMYALYGEMCFNEAIEFHSRRDDDDIVGQYIQTELTIFSFKLGTKRTFVLSCVIFTLYDINTKPAFSERSN